VLQFDCGSRHRAIYPNQAAVPGTRMPTLEPFLARYHDARQVLFGETKMPGLHEGAVDPVAFAKLVAAMVHRYGLEDRFILQSADFRTIDAMHAISPRIRTCLLYPWLAKDDYLELARQHHATCLLLRLQDADADEVRRLRGAGIMVISDVVDSEGDWGRYIDRGVDGVFTNDPGGLLGI
jgi:glycerophosphoryl diester phosphodiesterase